MQIIQPHPRTTESQNLGVGPALCVLISPQGDLDARPICRPVEQREGQSLGSSSEPVASPVRRANAFYSGCLQGNEMNMGIVPGTGLVLSNPLNVGGRLPPAAVL